MYDHAYTQCIEYLQVINKAGICACALISASDQENFQTVAAFDCRGLEPCDFSARRGWVVKAIDNGSTFTDVDLTEGEWADYCQKIEKPVSIYEIEHRFERMK
ncbi:CXXC motif containing zinc binding protein [Nomia melanderi]|uniref:CXXC motif containing zinc binding protein n=1 Tax=Nomia melanderi TaxID=2448451 RepID=UPI003FCC7B54